MRNLGRTLGLALVVALGAACDDGEDGADGAGGSGTDAGAGGGATGGAGGGATGGAGGTDGSGGSGGTGGGGGAGGMAEVEIDRGEPGLPASGLYYVTFNLVEFGNIPVPFQLDVMAGDGQLDRVAIRAIAEDAVSDELAVAENVAIDGDNMVEIVFGTFAIEGQFSPSGSDVELTVTLMASAWSGFLCGGVDGEVVGLGSISTSTFAAIPWDLRDSVTPPSSCGGEDAEGFDPIAECPQLAAGDVTGFMSAELERAFRLYLPEGEAPADGWPLVFTFHGVSDAEDLWTPVDAHLESSDWPGLAASEGFILVAPTSQPGNALEWQSTNPTIPTADLQFFDDMLTCINAQYDVDPARVHVTGHSGGGLYTVYLAMVRSDVIASVAAMDGGAVYAYPDPSPKIPVLLSWGGVEDVAFGQNFDTLATDLIPALSDHFVVACDHSVLDPPADAGENWSRHAWRPEAAPEFWRFLNTHPQGVDPSPWADGLPEDFWGICEIPQ